MVFERRITNIAKEPIRVLENQIFPYKQWTDKIPDVVELTTSRLLLLMLNNFSPSPEHVITIQEIGYLNSAAVTLEECTKAPRLGQVIPLKEEELKLCTKLAYWMLPVMGQPIMRIAPSLIEQLEGKTVENS